VSGSGSWRRVDVPGGVSFEVPADARAAGGTPVDSAAGRFDGNGYRITFDLGRFGERLDRLAEDHGVAPRALMVAGRPAREVAFAPTDEPFGWARIVQVELDDDQTLTIRVSCDRIERCGLADTVLASVKFAEPGRDD
jgi:hypothetical protein